MKEKIKALIEELLKEAASNEYVGKHGSPATSMAEDYAIGEVGAEQRKIAEKLRTIVEAE